MLSASVYSHPFTPFAKYSVLSIPHILPISNHKNTMIYNRLKTCYISDTFHLFWLYTTYVSGE